MSSVKDLERELADLREQLERQGIVAPDMAAVAPIERPDYIPFGSEKHMRFLGLEMVEDAAKAQSFGYTTYASPTTEKVYRLVDEMQAVQMYKPMDPDKSILLVLRQKVGAFESGKPQVPPGAPPLFGKGPNESIVEIQGVR